MFFFPIFPKFNFFWEWQKVKGFLSLEWANWSKVNWASNERKQYCIITRPFCPFSFLLLVLPHWPFYHSPLSYCPPLMSFLFCLSPVCPFCLVSLSFLSSLFLSFLSSRLSILSLLSSCLSIIFFHYFPTLWSTLNLLSFVHVLPLCPLLTLPLSVLSSCFGCPSSLFLHVSSSFSAHFVHHLLSFLPILNLHSCIFPAHHQWIWNLFRLFKTSFFFGLPPVTSFT